MTPFKQFIVRNGGGPAFHNHSPQHNQGVITMSSKSPKFSIPLVGSHFRPPAQQVLSILPAGTPLELSHEADNGYDPNAIAVFTDLSPWLSNPTKMSLLQDILPPELADSAEYLCHKGLFHLGYIARSGQKTARGGPGNAEVLLLASTQSDGMLALDAKLGLAIEGHPVVNISLKDVKEEAATTHATHATHATTQESE
jgi:hypothetical protein